MDNTKICGQDNEIDINKLCDQDEPEFTILTEMVRNQYLNYLEKQLHENFTNCYRDSRNESDQEKYKGSIIKRTAKALEDKAVEACMIAQYYQRAMVKIIAIVRRSTQENQLITQLEKSILSLEFIGEQTSTKETQTEAGLLLAIDKKPMNNKIISQLNHCSPIEPEKHIEDEETHEMTLDEKIEIFQKHLKNGHTTKINGRNQLSKNEYKSTLSKRNLHQKHSNKKTHNHHHNQRYDHQHHRPYKESRHNALDEEDVSPASTIITHTQSPMPPPTSSDPHDHVLTKSITEVVADLDNSNDSVALELARLFSEEKTELDEIFGIDPNQEPDDPQICKILKEIEQAKLSNEPEKPQENDLQKHAVSHSSKLTVSPMAAKAHATTDLLVATPTSCVDLGKSLWPCELFMQKRKLSESLARLIEEDLRWHDVIKWKFCELFGEDSDDEFTPCSPSIELDEILMSSCVKRISPWVVKHLMKPMRHGLIGNRFIFKKLAKHVARSIITENQYPDESIIKGCVENYFCLHQAVLTLDDLQDVPSISLE